MAICLLKLQTIVLAGAGLQQIRAAVLVLLLQYAEACRTACRRQCVHLCGAWHAIYAS
jgi:hypothetical protein